MQNLLEVFSTNHWHTIFTDTEKEQAITNLENGKILFFPQLAFALNNNELRFLSPDYVNPKKNISFDKRAEKLNGALGTLIDKKELANLLNRYAEHACFLITTLLPAYADSLIPGRTSLRPVEVNQRKTSYRKDDRRLHVDAFPSSPNQGNRILRVFCNINLQGEDRVWRIGEPFEKVAHYFMPKVKRPISCSSEFLLRLKITKSYRTEYDHIMLQLHDKMKASLDYQKNAEQTEIRFPPQSTWIVQTDQVSHAAMSGQHLLEQTFYLPVSAMQNPEKSPLKILERIAGRVLT